MAAAERDVVIVLDNSGSMRLNDPARLSISAVTDYIRAQDEDTRVAIVMFDSKPVLLQSLTPVRFDNRGQILGKLDSVSFNGQWTDTASAIERALYELRLNGRDNADKAIVLMTDGIIDTGNTQRDLEKARWLRERLAEDAVEQGVRIFGIAFTENADYELLQSIAQATEAEYFRAISAADIASVLQRIDQIAGRTFRRTTSQDDLVAPVTETQPAERIVFDEPVAAGTPAVDTGVAATSDPIAGGAIDSNVVAGAGEEESTNWRFILILLALMILGAVAVSIFWGDRVLAILRRARFQEPVDHGPSAVLYDVYDPSDIKRFELGGKPTVIGRVSGSDPAMDYIVVDERTVGRWHATIERRGQSFWIRDEGSVNGTFVNDQRVTSEHPLKHGDLVRVHRHEFEFVIPELFDSDRTMISNDMKAKRPEAATNDD